MDKDQLDDEAKTLILTEFTETTALELGLRLVEAAQTAAMPVVISIRTPDRMLFYSAFPGSTASNENWARRKSNTALHMQDSSLAVGQRLAGLAGSLADWGLDSRDYADHGGAVPIRVAGVGVVAVATVSGLTSVEDHTLVVEALRGLIRGMAPAAE